MLYLQVHVISICKSLHWISFQVYVSVQYIQMYIILVKLICCWIKMEPEILSETVFTSRLQIWPGFCKLLNSLQGHLKNFDYEQCMQVLDYFFLCDL